MSELPYTEYSPGAAKRSWWSGGVFGALAFVGACGILSIASSQHAANQASAERLEALTQTLASIHPGGFIPAASPSAHKFAITGVTPTDFQMNRGDCWLFATVGLLEDSYRRYGVARGWLKPDEYLHMSRQAFGVAVLDACMHHNSACAFDGDAIYTGNSTTGGEVELIYYLKEIGAAALPWSVCPYQQKSDWDPKTKTGLSDRLCVGRAEAMKVNPLKFNVRALKSYYNRMDIKHALVSGQRALSLSTAMIVVPYLLPCTAETKDHYRCNPDGPFGDEYGQCRPCPLERAYTGVSCCVEVNRSQYNLKGEWFHRPGEAIIKEGGHSIAIVGWNDHYKTETGLQGGWVIRNSWEDGFSLAHGSPVRGSRTLDWFMQRHGDLDERTICPNSVDPRMWYPCKDLKTCRDPETAMFAKSAHQAFHLECREVSDFYIAGGCRKGEKLYLKDQGGGQGFVAWGGGLSVACFVRAASGEEFCLPPMPIDDLGTIVKPVEAEAQLNRADLCGFYFVPYDTLETIEAELGGVWVSDFDIEWAPQSYAANQHLPAAKGKDYRSEEHTSELQSPI